jgi:hypothetical protein
VLNATSSYNYLIISPLFTEGVYSIKAVFSGDGNYSPTTEYHKLTILDTNDIPSVSLISPFDSESIDLQYNVTFAISDDSVVVGELMLYSGGVYNITLVSGLGINDTYFYWDYTVDSGFYDLVLRVCESGTLDNFCVNSTASIYLNMSCIPEWVPSYGGCLLNDTRYVEYDDVDSCNSSVGLPPDNGTYVSCDYCGADLQGAFYIPESCPENLTQFRYYVDNNYSICCEVTGLYSDCLVDYPPFANETIGCTRLQTDITLYADTEPYLDDRNDIIAEINISNATKCWTYVESENGLLQTSPTKTDYSDSLMFAKRTEEREYFMPVQGTINAYYTKENLVPYKEFILGVSCALDNGTTVSGETYITPKYDDLRKVTARTVWGATEIPTLLFVFVFVMILLGLVIYAFKR